MKKYIVLHKCIDPKILSYMVNYIYAVVPVTLREAKLHCLCMVRGTRKDSLN